MSQKDTVTGRDILAAIEKNGLEHLHGGWFNQGYGGSQSKPITAACIMGQAAINLEVAPHFFDQDNELRQIKWDLIGLNDGETRLGNQRKYANLVNIARRRLAPILDKTFIRQGYEQTYFVVRKDSK